MKTIICPACGCSLVRLGITPEKATVLEYEGREYTFCCDGCAEIFQDNAQALLEETKDLIVCPACLAEKPVEQAVSVNFQGETWYFCRCPYCVTVFQENPDYYIKRLSGEIEFSGVFSEGPGCCQ